MNFINFSDCRKSNRHGTYGGQAGDKDGILYNNEFWIVKYPKSTRSMSNINDMSYVSSPLSEYIGSKIYQMLGYKTHDTLLGTRNNKLVVACKDFCEHRGELVEMRTIKNAANAELSEKLEQEMHSSSTGERVNLNELLLHLEYNPILKQIPDIKEKFWEMVIIDVFIGNNDRNNGNWGLLYNEYEDAYSLAPIYDNGNSFNNKTPDEKIEEYYKTNRVEEIACSNRTAYDYNSHVMSAKKILNIENSDLQEAVKKVIPNIIINLENAKHLIMDIPASYNQYNVISDIRKQFYQDSLDIRCEKLLIPIYEKAISKDTPDITKSVEYLKAQSKTSSNIADDAKDVTINER